MGPSMKAEVAVHKERHDYNPLEGEDWESFVRRLCAGEDHGHHYVLRVWREGEIVLDNTGTHPLGEDHVSTRSLLE